MIKLDALDRAIEALSWCNAQTEIQRYYYECVFFSDFDLSFKSSVLAQYINELTGNERFDFLDCIAHGSTVEEKINCVADHFCSAFQELLMTRWEGLAEECINDHHYN